VRLLTNGAQSEASGVAGSRLTRRSLVLAAHLVAAVGSTVAAGHREATLKAPLMPPPRRGGSPRGKRLLIEELLVFCDCCIMFAFVLQVRGLLGASNRSPQLR